MNRFFNTAGPCRAERHYMLPPEQRLREIPRLLEREQYFVLHAPRQTGKTTVVLNLCRSLNASGRHAALYVNVENAQVAGGDVGQGMGIILSDVEMAARTQLPEELRPPTVCLQPAGTALERVLVEWTERVSVPTVLFIDEIDALQDETLLSVLRQLRAGYTAHRPSFPVSVSLIGLRDVRDYKVRVRPDSNSLGTASPFNIKSESLSLRNFTEAEVRELYGQHTQDTGQKFTEEALEVSFSLTQGQPWLVNALANQAVTEVAPDPETTVEVEHVLEAKELLIQRRDTHLDSLVDKLRQERVRRLIQPILTGGNTPFDVLNDDIAYVRDLGLVAPDAPLRIANPLYAEIIPRALSAVLEENITHQSAWYVREDGSLDMPALLRAFQQFFRENSEAWLERYEFREAGPHLMLMAFLHRVVNAGGTIEREFAIGSGRVDIVVRWREQVEVIELKLWRGERTEPQGIEQLTGYLERVGVGHGYLVIFDRRKDVSWDEKVYEREVEHEGRQIRVFGA